MTTATKQEKTFERAVGRRKTAAARVRLHPNGSGKITINDREFTNYFPTKLCQDIVMSPLKITGKEKTFDITVKIMGGGTMSQAEALRHGITRALIKWDEELKPSLRAEGFVTRDARAKERKKFGRHKARRGHQWRKR